MASQLVTQPPPTETFLLSHPAAHVLLITINRPKTMNSLSYSAQWEADSILQWFDLEPSLRVAIITGSGRAFCAGQDLIEQGMISAMQESRAAGEEVDAESLDPRILTLPPSGFMGVSRRTGKKPIIAAVNGFALGGGFEVCLGCDLIYASPNAKFSLPEASQGLFAAAGGLSRLVRLVGITIASEIAIAGRTLSAQEAVTYGIANRVSQTHESVVDEAVQIGSRIATFSPDGIIATRAGLRQGLEDGSVERATQNTDAQYRQRVQNGENFKIGMQAFMEKKQPQWVPSKL